MRTTPIRAAGCMLVGLTIGLTGCATHLSPSAEQTPIGQVAPAPQSRRQATVMVRTGLDPATVIAAVCSISAQATVGALVLDRASGTELLAINADRQFRSASLVKLLIAIDALSNGGDQQTGKLITKMLSLSNDDIASSLWVAGGGPAIVTRTSARLGLTGTRPPRTSGRWGDVLLTAHDVGRIYQFVLTGMPEQDRALLVNSLASAPRSASDGFDQHFGIPDGLGGRFAIKQGWSDSPTEIVLHTSGLVGDGWRHVVVVLTEHPLGVPWRTAARSVTAGTKALSPLV